MSVDGDLPGDITAILNRWGEGDSGALSQLAPIAYDQLKLIAHGFLRREGRNHTLQATALVNELFLRLARQHSPHLSGRIHFYTLSAMIMRRILTDYARQSHAEKRPGSQRARVPLHEDLIWIDAASEDMLALDRAMADLEKVDERVVRTIELRYFLGCTNVEAAELLGVSRATLDRDLEFGKAWLYRRLTQNPAVARAIKDQNP